MFYKFNVAKLGAVLFTILLWGCSSPANIHVSQHYQNIERGELHAQILGTSSIYLSDENTSILIDGFFTRQGFWASIFRGMEPNELTIENTLNNANISKVDYLLVAHAHYDHALDSALVANKTNAKVFASDTTLSVISPKNFEEITPNTPSPPGTFDIHFLDTPHIKKLGILPYVESFILWSTRGTRFKNAGKTYSFLINHQDASVLIVPSANFPEKLELPNKVDIVFLSIGLLSHMPEKTIEQYWYNTVVKTGARIVIPIHWDDFTNPITKNLSQTPSYIDDLDKTLTIFNQLAKLSGTRIVFPEAITPFSITQLKADEGEKATQLKAR